MAFIPAVPLPLRGSSTDASAVCGAPRRAVVVASAAGDVPDVLVKILARKEVEVAALKGAIAANDEHPVGVLLGKRGDLPRSRRFEKALTLPKGTLTVIAEIKRQSPSKGVIGNIKDPAALARTYYEGGAGVISVLTDKEGFGGTLEDLEVVVKQMAKFKGNFPEPCPVLRKDFVVDEVQIAEAAVSGASAVLLIMSALGRERCGELQEAAWEMGLDALVEVHDEKEVEDAVAIGAKVVGVNNRNLRTFEVDLDTSLRMADVIPDGVIKVAESGIEECVDAWKLRDAGFSAVLVGESLVRAFEGSVSDSTSYSIGYNQAKGLIKAFKAKGSAKFGPTSNAAFWGAGEGAKESLVRWKLPAFIAIDSGTSIREQWCCTGSRSLVPYENLRSCLRHTLTLSMLGFLISSFVLFDSLLLPATVLTGRALALKARNCCSCSASCARRSAQPCMRHFLRRVSHFLALANS